MESVAKLFVVAEEHAGEREERMRKFQLQTEERRIEREDR